MRVAIYARKSTDDQLKASITRQVEHARLYAQQKGWSVHEGHVYVDDGISGAEFDRRHGLRHLLDAALRTPRAFDGVVTADADRVGRALRAQMALSDLHDAGIRVSYYLTNQEQRLESATDRAILSLTGFGAELEREKAKQRTRDALSARARKGLVTGGVVYGYRNVPVYEGTDSSGNPIRAEVRYAVDPDEARIVLAIFQAFVDGFGLRSIAKGLNGDPEARETSERYLQGRCVPPPRRGTGSWGPSTVRAILHNEKYIGRFDWGKNRNVDKGGRTRRRSTCPSEDWVRVENPALRIVPENLWQAARARQRPPGTSGGPARGYLSASLLSGNAKCGVCGGPLVITGSRKRERCYGCSHHRNRGAVVCPNGLLESVSVVDRRLLEEIERHVLTPEARGVALAYAYVAIDQSMAGAAKETAHLEAALARASREIENLLRAVEKGEAPRTLLDRLRQREKEYAALTRQLASAKSLRTISQLERHRIRRRLEDGFSRLAEVLSSERRLARQALDKLIVDRVRFTPVQIEGELTYRFEAKLSLGRICAAVAQNDGDVPDGI